jgi:hypothetical protein
MKRKLFLVIITFIIAIMVGCSSGLQAKQNVENKYKDSKGPIVDKVYKNNENGNMLVANSNGSFILYTSNSEPIIAIGGSWKNNSFLSESEFVKCIESNYIFIRKSNKNTQEGFIFNESEWGMDIKLSAEKLYNDKVSAEGNIYFLSEFTTVDYELKNEEILNNSILQYGESALGSTYDSILIFSEDNVFRYYCSGFGTNTKEEAESYKKRIKYLIGNWEIENNQIIFKIDESQIKTGGNVEYDEISMFNLVDYEITNELDDTIFAADFAVNIDNTDPRYKSYIEINGDKYYFLSGYKLYHNKESIDNFILNFSY